MANLPDDDETPTNTRSPSPSPSPHDNQEFDDESELLGFHDMMAVEDDDQSSLPNNTIEDQCRCKSTRCQGITLSRALDLTLGSYPNTQNQAYLTPNHIEKLWPILTRGQMDRETYLTLLAEYCPQRHCSAVWQSGTIAYRCRTCSRVPSMALCADCFRSGSHDGHDYIMFKSVSGGTCDCGMGLLVETGHCTKHGFNAVAKRANEKLPEELICVPRRTMPRFVHRLLISLRAAAAGGPHETGSEFDMLMDSLTQLACDSAILRCLIVDALISESVYDSQIQLMTGHPDETVSSLISNGLKCLEQARKCFISVEPPAEWNAPKIRAFDSEIKINSFVEELVFWTVCLEFPQKLVSFLLSFQMDDRYKEVFARTFTRYYPYIMMNLVADADENSRRHLKDSYRQMVLRIIQVSSQIHGDIDLVNTLCSEDFTLHTLIYCLRLALELGSPSKGTRGLLKDNPSCTLPPPFKKPKIISHNSTVITNGHLMPFTQDLNIILSYKRESIRLISCPNLLNIWLEMLNYFQTMNPSKRFGERDIYTDDYTLQNSIFALEIEFCLCPLWAILDNLKSSTSSDRDYAVTLFQAIHANLLRWFIKMGMHPNCWADPHRMSFYIPLHRMFGVALRSLMFVQSKSNQEICDIISENLEVVSEERYKCNATLNYYTKYGRLSLVDFCKMLMIHPLEIIVVCNEARSIMGMRILGRGQAVVTYNYMAYCYSTIDLDMLLLRFCGSKLESNYFLKTMIKKFSASDWFSLVKKPENQISDLARNFLPDARVLPEQMMQLSETPLLVILQLLTLTIWCNVTERDQTKQEMIAIISVRDRSYSYLVDMMPEKNIRGEYVMVDKKCKSILEEIAVFNPAQHGHGRQLQQGSYTLKPSTWANDFDPVQVQYRFSQKRDYQMSLERYYRACKQSGLLPRDFHSYSSLWPPFKVPRSIGCFGQLDLSGLLESQTITGLIFSVLYKSLYQIDVPDSMMAPTIFLLELALRKCLESKSKAEKEHESTSTMNTSFTGYLRYEVLMPYATSNYDTVKGYPIGISAGCEEGDRFPVVREALDVSYDTTWFPFKSVIDNLLVYVENVHESMSEIEFTTMLKNMQEDIKQSVPRSSEPQVATCSKNPAHSPTEPLDWTSMDTDFFIDVENTTTENLFVDSDDDGDISFNAEDEAEAQTMLQQTNFLWPTQPVRATQTPQVSMPSDREDDERTESYEEHVMPQSQSTALSLMPINQQNQERQELNEVPANDNQQVQAENLVTPRRAIQASDPRPMIEAALQPLALEASPTSTIQTGKNTQRQSQERTPVNSPQRSRDGTLTENDIQARFTNFFNPSSEEQGIQRGPRNAAMRSIGGHRDYYLNDHLDNVIQYSRNTTTPTQQQNPGTTSQERPLNAPFLSLARPGRNLARRTGPTGAQTQSRDSNDQNESRRHPGRVLLSQILGSRSLARLQGQPRHQHQRQLNQRNIKQADGSKQCQQDKGVGSSKERIGESLLTLLLRLHAKYSQKSNSYEFDAKRAQANGSVQRSRIGDGVHFVTIVLDLVCILNVEMKEKLKQLQNLIWPDKEVPTAQTMGRLKMESVTDDAGDRTRSVGGKMAQTTTDSFDDDLESRESRRVRTTSKTSDTSPSSVPLSQAERRRRAKEYQSKVMAEFANKQKAFIQSLGSTACQSDQGHRATSKVATTACSDDEEPINLSSKVTKLEHLQHDSPVLTDHDKEPSAMSIQKDDSARQDTLDKVKSQQASLGCSGKSNKEYVPIQLNEVPPTIYECCICGLEGESDLANPFGQVVHLQSTSILGHAHLRPQSERKLPCDESHHTALREETYAKYLERRIDLLCQHFSESSWLDSINIGVEGGVHVQSCGHYLHIECYQSYMKTVNHDRRQYTFAHEHQGLNTSDEFPCPVCRQLANSLLPILRPSSSSSSIGPYSSSHPKPGHLPLEPEASIESNINESYQVKNGDAKDDLGAQIKLFGSLLSHRSPPHYKELQSSASFCAHLTKATGPQYRLVRSNASMHSLFLFLTSIARTNLESELIVRLAHSRAMQLDASKTNNQYHQQVRETPHASTSDSSPIPTSSATAAAAAAATGGSSSTASDKQSCFLNLFHVLALNARTLINDQWFSCNEIWSRLTNCIDEKNRLSVKPTNSNEVPLLLRDPVAMLLQFLFATIASHSGHNGADVGCQPLLANQANFACLVKILFNLTAVQSIALLLSHLEVPTERQNDDEEPLYLEEAQNDVVSNKRQLKKFHNLLTLVRENLGPMLSQANEEPLMNTLVRNSWSTFSSSSPMMQTSGCCPGMEVDGKESTSKRQVGQNYSLLFVENRVKLACLPFMRAAALLQHYLYPQSSRLHLQDQHHNQTQTNNSACYPELRIVSDELLTNAEAIETDFSTLATYLGLFGAGSSSSNTSTSHWQVPTAGSAETESETRTSPFRERRGAVRLTEALNWPPAVATVTLRESSSSSSSSDNEIGTAELIGSWSKELLVLCREFSIAARSLLVCRPLAWFSPSLMTLPQLFDDVFMFYYRKKCSLCHQVRRDVAVCLVCGAPICFRMSCCKERARSRLVHSQHCGSSTSVFLAVHTSSIVVIQGQRASVWGSVYLDAHGEEDNGLHRGKPLYLVPARFELLQRQWLTHSFDDKYSKLWINLNTTNHHQ